MKINIAIRPSKKRDVITKLVNHYVDFLGISNSKVTLTVDTVTGYAKDHDAYGGVLVEGKDIYLALDADITKFMSILVLAHEMVHVKQVARGLLTYVGGRSHWRGKDLHNLPYDEKPWEIQANREMHNLLARLEHVIVPK